MVAGMAGMCRAAIGPAAAAAMIPAASGMAAAIADATSVAAAVTSTIPTAMAASATIAVPAAAITTTVSTATPVAAASAIASAIAALRGGVGEVEGEGREVDADRLQRQGGAQDEDGERIPGAAKGDHRADPEGK
jgi:hypothetical protein